MKFGIQTINNEVKHDFSFALLRSLEFLEWLYDKKEFDLEFHSELGKTSLDCVPVGSVEFVLDHLKRKTNTVPKPRNVPECLFFFAGREILNTNKDFILNSDDNLFIKSNDKIKEFSAFSEEIDLEELKDIEYQVSDFINIYSEYRCFVYRNKLIDVRRYSGDFDMFPDIETINNMIKTFRSEAPIAYTLDVGVMHRGKTVIIEVHDFFSCGVYGFDDKIYPIMLTDWYREFLKKQWIKIKD